MRTGVVVQARMASTRFPGKVLSTLNGKPLLTHIMERLAMVPADEHFVATDEASFEALRPVVHAAGWSVFVGPTDDVMLRVMECARENDLEVVVRATGDNPLVDAEAAARFLDLHVWGQADATRPIGMTPGTAVEVVTTAALESAWPGASAWQREHVMPAVYESGLYRVTTVWCRPTYREAVTVDTPADLERVARVMGAEG